MAVTTYQHGSTVPLPDHLPAATRCIQIQLPDDPQYFQLFYGQLARLTDWYAYDRDAAKRGKDVAKIWRKVLRSIRPCESGVTVVGCGCECECCGEEMEYRQQGCLLQKFDCLTGDWVTIFDGSLCNPNPAPGGGTTPPIGGACENYTLSADSRATTPLPFLVNSGDTIQFTSIMGAATDGSGTWYCPDGSIFIAGACAGGGYTQPTDPLNTTHHMALLLKIGSSYYPLTTALFTVPTGVINQAIYVQTNDPSLIDNSGTFALSLTYCNNAAPPTTSWCQILDFTVSPQGFVSLTITDGCGDPVDESAWGSSNGWEALGYIPSCVTHTQIFSQIALDLGVSTTITSVELKGHCFSPATAGRILDVGLFPTYPPGSGSTHPISDGAYPTGDYDLSSGAISVVTRSIVIAAEDVMPGVGSGSPGYVHKSLTLRGTGTNPFMSSNCT